jgi:hypothetical protein
MQARLVRESSSNEDRRQAHELVLLDLDLNEKTQRGELRQQRAGVRVIRRTVIRGVHCDAHDARGLEPFEFRGLDIVAHDGNAFEPSRTVCNGIQETAIVGAVSGIRSNDQCITNAVRIEHFSQLCCATEFLPAGAVSRVCHVRKPQRIEDMIVAIDLGFIVNIHRRRAGLTTPGAGDTPSIFAALPAS